MTEHDDTPRPDLDARLRRSLDRADDAPALPTSVVEGAPDRRAPRLVNRGRVAQASGGAVLALAGATAIALVVVPATLPRTPDAPLFTVAGGGAAGPEAATLGMADESRIAQWIEYTYLAGPGLGTDAGRGRAYALERPDSAEQSLREIAAVVGIEGEPTDSSYSDPTYPTLLIGTEDGSGPSLVLGDHGTGAWWYSDPTANPVFAPDEANPQPAGAVPSEEEARADALEIFEATGLDLDADDIRVQADEWQVTASASLEVGDVRTAVEWAASWSSTGELAWASGHTAQLVDRGEYGTVSAVDAVDRLADGRWFGSGGPDYQGGVSILADGAARAESGVAVVPIDPDAPVASPVDPGAPAEPTEVPSTGAEPDPAPSAIPDNEPQPKPDMTVEPLPGTEPAPVPLPEPEPTIEPLPEPLPEPMPEPSPEQVTVTLEEAEATMLLVWDAQGDAWLVPGYAFLQPEGWYTTVISLEEGVIALPEPVEVELFREE